MSVDYSAARLA